MIDPVLRECEAPYAPDDLERQARDMPDEDHEPVISSASRRQDLPKPTCEHSIKGEDIKESLLAAKEEVERQNVVMIARRT